MSSVIEISQIMGPMWSVAGRGVVVPAGESAPLVVLGAAFASVDGAGPWKATLKASGQVHDLVLGMDGSVTLASTNPAPPARTGGFLRWSRRGSE